MINAYILSFDIAAIFIFIITLYYIFSNGLYKRKSGRVFVGFIVLTIVTAIYDLYGAYTIDYYGDKDFITYAMVRDSNVLFFLFRTLSIFAYFLYMIDITYSLKLFWKNKKLKLLVLFLPFIMNIILSILTIWYPVIFDLVRDGDNLTYVRNTPVIVLFYLVMIYASIIILYLIIKCRSIFAPKQLISITSIIPLTIIGIFVQVLFEEVLVILFSQALSAILIVTSVETISEQIDYKTHLGNYKRFTNDLKRVFLTGFDQSVLVVKIKNYHELYSMYTISKAIGYLRGMVRIQSNEYKKYGIDQTDFYSLGNGIYTFITNEKAVKKISSFVYNTITSEMVDGYDFKPEGSICIMGCCKDFNSWEDVLDFITAYKNLTKYDNKLVHYKDILNDKTFNIERNLDKIIDDGLKENEFEVYYQPIYNIRKKRFTAAEALVRLNSKKYGFIRPDLFINYAEHNGRIGEIDNFVLDSVAQFVTSDTFKSLGLDYIEVNLSVVECQDKALIQRIEEIVNKYNLDPRLINLEITESVDYINKAVMDSNIASLRRMGFNFSLDDYGVGYSNIERFATLPISIVKIDKSLVDDADKPSMQSVLVDTFRLIHDLNRQTVVEGVETKDQLRRFISLKATYIQGYYFSKPLEYREFIDFLNKSLEVEL